jgi:hypothetical protein
LLQAGDKESVVEVGERLKVVVDAYFDARFLDVYPYLARLLNVPLAGEALERVVYLNLQALSGRIRKAFAELLEALAQDHPLAFVWEDLYWPDHRK